MRKPPKIDPYCAFEDDRERRIALVSRSRWQGAAAIAFALAASGAMSWQKLGEGYLWLISLLHKAVY